MDLEGLVQAFTPSGADPDSVFNIILVLSSKRANVEIGEIPGIFTPITGKWKLKGEITTFSKKGASLTNFLLYRIKDLLKVFVDDEDYYSPHGRAYETYGIEPGEGALVVVRPDQRALDPDHLIKLGNADCVLDIARIGPLDDVQGVDSFFSGFLQRLNP